MTAPAQRLTEIQQRLDAAETGTIAERGAAEMELHRHAWADTAWLLTKLHAAHTVIQAARELLAGYNQRYTDHHEDEPTGLDQGPPELKYAASDLRDALTAFDQRDTT